MIAWLTDTLLTTGALLLLVLLVRRPVSRWFGPGIAYALWAVPLIRMMLPPLVLPGSLRPAQAVTEAPTIAAATLPEKTVTIAASTPSAISPVLVLLAIWLGGAALFLGWRIRAYFAARRLLLDGARPMGEIGGVRIIESGMIASPIALGVRDKLVALPRGFLFRTDPAARELAIAHELEHHAARDLAVNIAFQPLLALHWFNPLAWLAWRALRQDQEAACDARVLAGRGREERHRYGRLIASLASGTQPTLAAAMAGPVLGRKAIVHRLRRIAAAEPSARRRTAGRGALALALLAVPLTASISYAASDNDSATPTKREVRRVVVREDDTNGDTASAAPASERVVHRGDRTYVFRTEKPLSDAEVEARIARADADLPEPPQPPPPGRAIAPPAPDVPDAPAAPLAPPAPPAPPQAAGECDAAGERIVDANGRENPAAVAALNACVRRQVASALREADAARRAALREAGVERGEALREANAARREAAADRAEARDAVRAARAEVANESSLSDSIRATVMNALDIALAGMNSKS